MLARQSVRRTVLAIVALAAALPSACAADGQKEVRSHNAFAAADSAGTAQTTAMATDGPSAQGLKIAARITRLAPGTQPVLVSSGVPLPPGALSNAALVHVTVDGKEQPIFAQLLAARHPDGSATSVLIQFPSSATGAAEISVGAPRATSLPKQPAPGLPDAILLPTSPDYLVSTLLVGPTLTVSNAAKLSPFVVKYDADFKPFADVLWAKDSSSWGENFYDRAQAYYAQWVRTGDVAMWVRGTRQALGYRVGYLEDAQYGTSPHWAQVDGLAEHYQLTGDEKSRFAVGRVAETLRYFRGRAAMDIPDIEGRILARTLTAQLWGYRLQAAGNDPPTTRAPIDTLIDRILARQSPDGSWRFTQSLCAPHAGNFAYMDGMLAEALVQSYMNYKADPRIPVAVQHTADYLWSQWDVKNQGVKYAPDCPPAEHNIGVPELNNLMLTPAAWTYARTGIAKYREQADSMFNAGVRHQFLQGSKQFNQQYSVSFRYFAWRAAR